ncbi:hypothetical protein GC088_14540 [Arthrobacter sp. JZ12]|uniref:hypothetical protein n=1 Tax=Arthrobacter sp. JZ12 TaxID=2654190 RepID=UPI002B48B2BB|nr:hypothetical protein [Arthrobacter sp. JZ12]WRH26165.1 hypothetical protein GC088_14540 [Arthrobacter sp. JZ12]
MSTEGNDIFTANDADRLEQQAEVADDSVEEDTGETLNPAAREANEADVVEQALPVYGDEDYPRGPIDEEPV